MAPACAVPPFRLEPVLSRMAYFDSHCHLDPMRFHGELLEVLSRARGAGVSGMAVIGTRAVDSEAWLQELQQRRPATEAPTTGPLKPTEPLTSEEVEGWLKEFGME